MNKRKTNPGDKPNRTNYHTNASFIVCFLAKHIKNLSKKKWNLGFEL